jgi:hypothetical protein
LKLVGVVHFHQDVVTADKLAFDVDLRKRRPAGKALGGVADRFV